MCPCSVTSCLRLFVTPWAIAHQAPLVVGFSRQEYWSGLLCSSPGDLPDSGIDPASPASPALQGNSLPPSQGRSPPAGTIGGYSLLLCLLLSLDHKALIEVLFLSMSVHSPCPINSLKQNRGNYTLFYSWWGRFLSSMCKIASAMLQEEVTSVLHPGRKHIFTVLRRA